MHIFILSQRGYALLVGPGSFEVSKDLSTIHLTGCLIVLPVHSLLCMFKRNIFFLIAEGFLSSSYMTYNTLFLLCINLYLL